MTLRVRSDRFVWRRLSDGGAFVVDLGSGDHVVLNGTAAEFVSALGAGEDLAAIGRSFCRKYGAPPAELEADLEALSRELSALGLLSSEENA